MASDQITKNADKQFQNLDQQYKRKTTNILEYKILLCSYIWKMPVLCIRYRTTTKLCEHSHSQSWTLLGK